jgi:hypothetical protein
MVELSEQSLTPEEEIKKLESQLEQKKREFTAREGLSSVQPQEHISPPVEKELFREVLKEHIESLRPPPQTQPTPPSILSDTQQTYLDVKTQVSLDEEIKALIEKALTEGIEKAIRSAEQQTPYLLDELHDHLIDDYYEKLIQLKKIKTL